ncbi:DNA translocase FtsK [Bacillus ginsengihumi]|uniref:DNA translocase FtsK n=1 Tax=Heyndrickxia ginsengihumi TaxID=363870 RepID=A0A6M0PAS0_9BACI|nr:DNA translocase FtsK [Heyndrickxia ginsengihumi]
MNLCLERVIMLNWFKKVTNFFKDDEDDVIEEIKPKQKKKLPMHREIDTRVTYQYPKSNFRFPMIPDETQGHTLHKKETSKKQYEEAKKQITKKMFNASSSQPRTNIERKGNQPFRPTNIPSPIYGFNRPEAKRKQVEQQLEYERTDYTIHEIEVKDSFNNEKAPETNSINHVMKVRKGELQSAAEEAAATAIENELTENAIYENELNDTSENKKVIEGDLVNKAVVEACKEKPIGAETVIENELTENAIYENELNDTSENEKVIEDDFVNKAEADKEKHEHAIKETAELAVENNDLQLSEEIEEIHHDHDDLIQNKEQNDEKEESILRPLIEDHPPVDSNASSNEEEVFMKEQTETELPVQEQARQDATLNEEKPMEKERRRNHLPFNVLMLKQDRKKYIETQQRKEVQEVEKKTEINNENAEVELRNSYPFPSLSLLKPPIQQSMDEDWVKEQSHILDQALQNFNVKAKVVNVSQGPSVTRYEVQPEPGVKVNKITNLNDDLKLSLAARDIRIEAPIPGKHTVGIEIPNLHSRPVYISEIIKEPVFKHSTSPLTVALGLDISGNPIVTDLQKMPHGLIAGATGSGKSVCINSILVSLLYKATPHDLKLLMIDPKMVELAPYNHIPHLVSPVITDVKLATAALKWAVEEMERRYELFAHKSVRDIHRFNQLAEKNREFSDKLPYIVIVIDELADLMMTSPADVEDAICRIAQKARACGIHLIVATQRPSVDVITGLIKANIPTRIAFSVSSQVDSRTIIDIGGAEKLLGKGDMLFLENGSSKPVRLQGTFVSDEEIDDIVSHTRTIAKPEYLFQPEELMKHVQMNDDEDELFFEACQFVIDQGGASTSLLQRNFRIGYNRAARLIDLMEQQGIISEAKGSKPRDILMSRTEFEQLQEYPYKEE